MAKELFKNLTIESAEDATKKLLKHLKTAKDPVVDLSGVEKIDLAGIQILISGQKYSENNDDSLYYSGALNKKVYDKLIQNGFKTVSHPDNEDLYRVRRNSREL